MGVGTPAGGVPTGQRPPADTEAPPGPAYGAPPGTLTLGLKLAPKDKTQDQAIKESQARARLIAGMAAAEKELAKNPNVFRPEDNLTAAEMAAAKPAPETGSITGTKGVDIASTSPTAPRISSTDLPPADTEVAFPNLDIAEKLGLDTTATTTPPAPELPDTGVEPTFAAQPKIPKEALSGYADRPSPLAGGPVKVLEKIASGITGPASTLISDKGVAEKGMAALDVADIALQLAGGAKAGDIVLNKIKGEAVNLAARAATQAASQAAISGLDATADLAGANAATLANLGIASTPVVSTALNMALSGAPITAKNVAESAMRSSLLAGPQMALAMDQAAVAAGAQAAATPGVTAAGAATAALPFAAMMAIKAGIDIKQAQDKGLFRKRAYEDAAFSAPVVNLQPYMTRLSQPVEKGGTGHSVKEIQELFKPSRPDELNYLGGQLARELDPPDGAKYYHGDESTRKMMEKNLGIIQKYRNTIPAYADVWDKFSRGQISHPQFKAESQKAVDNYIVGKLGARRVVKPEEIWFRGEYLDMSKKGNAQTYYEQTRRTPPGWGVYRGPEEDELYNLKERAELLARRRAEDSGD